MSRNRFRAVLRTLTDFEVEFLVVGGVAAVLQGAPVNTFDIDVVHAISPANVARLGQALVNLEACYRFRPELRPNESHLSTTGHQLLRTRYGSLDVLGAIGKGRTYGDLLPHSQWITIADGLRVRVLDLETQIAVKEEIRGEKDLAVLPVLRATLAEIRRRQQTGPRHDTPPPGAVD